MSLDVLWTKIKFHIGRGHPMIIGTETPAHFWVVCGYKRNASGVRQIWVMNPTFGSYQKIGLKKLRGDYDLQTLMFTSKQVH